MVPAPRATHNCKARGYPKRLSILKYVPNHVAGYTSFERTLRRSRLVLQSPASPGPSRFLFSNADVTLRSSDGVLFRVSSDGLCRASAWFQTKFTLPQSASSDRTEPIPVDEPANILADVLAIINGSELPALDNADHLEALPAVADKYEMSMALSVIRMALFSRLLDASPMRLYSIACRTSWEKEAMEASSRTLGMDLLAPAAQSELAALEPTHHNKLLNLHQRRQEQFLSGLDDEATFYANIRGGQCNPAVANSPCIASLSPGILPIRFNKEYFNAHQML
ncbi:hypothetical protein BD414DRAFT_245215 [Trametes punicea]|nr:hypothetical protein BD414DRAFT_245215 [Trametes punicea]